MIFLLGRRIWVVETSNWAILLDIEYFQEWWNHNLAPHWTMRLCKIHSICMITTKSIEWITTSLSFGNFISYSWSWKYKYRCARTSTKYKDKYNESTDGYKECLRLILKTTELREAFSATSADHLGKGAARKSSTIFWENCNYFQSKITQYTCIKIIAKGTMDPMIDFFHKNNWLGNIIIQPQNLNKTSVSKSRPNVANTFLTINNSNTNNTKKFWVGIFKGQSHISQVSTTGVNAVS